MILVQLNNLNKYNDAGVRADVQYWLVENVGKDHFKWVRHNEPRPHISGVWLNEEDAVAFKLRFKVNV